MQILINSDNRTDRKPFRWTEKHELRCEDVLSVVEELEDYWPLTLRQIFYQVISQNLHEQDHWMWAGKPVNVYNAMVPLVKWMRIDNRLGWNVVHDEHRSVHYFQRFEDTDEFIQQETRNFLTGYTRCKAQGQPRHIEIWLEKQTLLHIIKDIGERYCRRIVVCRGYNSFSFQTDFYRRAKNAIAAGQTPTVLYLGDWDPSGVDMLTAAAQTLQEELGLYAIEYHRIGINPEHFDMVPADPLTAKPTDTRAKKFIENYGDVCYELDALHPEELRELTEEGILDFTDLDIFDAHDELEGPEIQKMAELRESVIGTIKREAEKF